MKSHKIKRQGILMAVCALLMVVPTSMAQLPFGGIETTVSGVYLGITMEQVTAENMSRYQLRDERGVIVRSVMNDSPAERAALEVDDVILEYGGFNVWSTLQFSRLVQETPDGRNVALLVSRNGNLISLKATIALRELREQRQPERRMERFPQDLFGPDGFFGFRDRMQPESRSRDIHEEQSRLGISGQPLTEQLGEFFGVPERKGVLVASVETGSPSDGKLKSGDVIIEVDGRKVESPDELARFVREKSPGTLIVKIIRDKKEATVELSTKEGRSKYRL
jgi:S1-C subfamily serine protease